MPIRIHRVDRVVADIGVEVQALRVGEGGVGHGNRRGAPVGQQPASGLRLVVARGEVVQAAFGVVLLAGEVVLGGVHARAQRRLVVAEGQALHPTDEDLSAGTPAGSGVYIIAPAVGLVALGAQPIRVRAVDLARGRVPGAHQVLAAVDVDVLHHERGVQLGDLVAVAVVQVERLRHA